MGDRTYMQVRIGSCPDDKVDEVIDLLDNYGFTQDEREGEGLAIGASYSDDEGSSGTFCYTLAPKLIEMGVAFDGWEDPVYEHPGFGCVNIPGVGTSEYTCFQDGEPVYSLSEVLETEGRGKFEDVKKLFVAFEELVDKLVEKPLLPKQFATEEVRVSQLEVGDRWRDFGDDEWNTIARIGHHGDTVLFWHEDGGEAAEDIDHVVERRVGLDG